MSKELEIINGKILAAEISLNELRKKRDKLLTEPSFIFYCSFQRELPKSKIWPNGLNGKATTNSVKKRLAEEAMDLGGTNRLMNEWGLLDWSLFINPHINIVKKVI